MVNLKHLRAFAAVAQELHFTKAAELMCISQPALSALIKQLETWAEVPLIHRNTRQVELTQAGREYYASVRQMLQDFDQAGEQLKQFKSIRRGRVRMAALPSLCASVLARTLANFRHDYPDITLEVFDLPGAEIMEALLNREVDLACSYANQSPEINAELFLKDSLALLCPSDSPLAAYTSVTWRQLANQPLIAMAPGTTVRTLIEGVTAANDLSLNIVLEPKLISTAMGYVCAGLGVAVLPTAGMEPLAIPGVACIDLREPQITRDISVLTLKGYGLSPAADALRKMILQ
ncbi:LysR family transcriptional regulator [Halioxenophilus aromaticivorans]